MQSIERRFGVQATRDANLFRTHPLQGSEGGQRGGFIDNFLRDPEYASRRIEQAEGRFAEADILYRAGRQRGATRISRRQAYEDAGVNIRDEFIRDALLLNAAGQPSGGTRFATALLGRRGQRLRPFGIQGFQSPITRQGLRSPFISGGVRGAGIGASLLSLPGLIAIGAAGFGGATLGQTAFERAGRNEELNFLNRTIIGASEGFGDFLAFIARDQHQLGLSTERLTGRFNQLSDSTEALITGGIENFNTLLSAIASANANLLRSFGDLQLQTRGGTGELTLQESQLVTGNPVFEAFIRQSRISPEAGFGNQPDFSRAETRTGTLAFFAQRQLFPNTPNLSLIHI